MNTGKKEVFIWLQHENCYLVEEMNLWWENKYLMGWVYKGWVFPGGGNEPIFVWCVCVFVGGGGSLAPIPQQVNPAQRKKKQNLQNFAENKGVIQTLVLYFQYYLILSFLFLQLESSSKHFWASGDVMQGTLILFANLPD